LLELVSIDRCVALAINGAVISALIEALQRSRRRERAAGIMERCTQRRFERLFHASPLPLSLSKLEDRTVIAVNDAYLKMFGVRREQILGHTPQEIGIEVERRDELLAKLHSQASIEAQVAVRTAAGVHEVRVWSSVVELDDDSFAFTTFLDVTDQVRDQEAARASDERMRELAENVREVFWITDAENANMLYISPIYEKMFGRRCADLYVDARDWLLAIHPDDRDRMRDAIPLMRVKPYEDDYRIVLPTDEVRTIHISVTQIRDANGEVVRLAGVADDVTDKLALEAQMRQTQKLESLGLLAGGVAHDFNNILAVVAANACLLAETTAEGEDRELVQEIEAAVQRATSLTRQLLAFSRKQVIEPIVVDLNAAVGDTRKMLRRMLGEDISIITSLEPELGHVLIDPGYLVQVMMNLAVNARDAMPRGGTLTITTRTVKRGDASLVMLAVADSGCGMPPEVAARIFEPFYTTKGVGRGTGLGLSVVHGIVEQSGGSIEVESAVDVGTTMKIYLPFVDAPAERITNVTIAGATGTEQIVLVDDDMYVRAAASRSLRARGFHVFEASDGQAALRLLADHKDVALLVTDVVMPTMDGRQLVEAARLRRPSLKVLYISGYNDDAVLHHGVESAKVALIEKPFRGHALVGKVRQIIDAV
jgi:PAS domain S-box-containing protein